MRFHLPYLNVMILNEHDVLMVIKPEIWEILKGERFTFKVDINKDELLSTERDKYQWLSHKYVDFLNNVCTSHIECIKELTDTCIVGWKDGEVHSLTAIRVNKNGKVSYGRTVKY